MSFFGARTRERKKIYHNGFCGWRLGALQLYVYAKSTLTQI